MTSPSLRKIPIPPHLRDTVELVARHEVGHMIAAKALGFRTGAVTVQITDLRGGYQGGAEITLGKPLRTVDAIVEYLGSRTVVLWAGALAETLRGASEPDQGAACKCLRGEGGKTDHAKACELVNLIRNLQHPETQNEAKWQAEVDKIEKELWIRAVDVVTAERELICGIARRLAQMVKEVGPSYALSAQEIDVTPNIVKRFGAQPPEVREEPGCPVG